MKLATWNLWWRYGDSEKRQPGILKTLTDLDADVLALQEIWHDDDENFAAHLADSLGYDYAFSPSPNPSKWQRKLGTDRYGIGNAVISRWPIVFHTTTDLPSGAAPDEGRIALHAKIKTPHGALPFTCTHLNSAWGHSNIRAEQLRAIGEFVQSEPTAPFPPVVCGDFNAMPDFDEVRAFSGKSAPLLPNFVMLDAWYFVHPLRPGFTWDQANTHVDEAHEPSARIDYVFVGPANNDGVGKALDAGLFGTKPVDGVWPSDHFGVWVELKTN